jgi:hypothetical protein
VFECPEQVSTRKVLGSITRNLNVDLAGDQYLRTSCICLRLQDLFRVMSVSMQDSVQSMYLSASIRRLPAPFGWSHWSSSCWKVGDLIDYDSLPLDNSCEVEDVSEVLFLSRRMYSKIQRTVNRSGCKAGEPIASWVCSSTNSSKYGARYIRYQTNTITAPQNESANRVLHTLKHNGWIQAPYTKYEIGFRLHTPNMKLDSGSLHHKSRMDSGSIHRHTPHIVRVKEKSRRALHAERKKESEQPLKFCREWGPSMVHAAQPKIDKNGFLHMKLRFCTNPVCEIFVHVWWSIPEYVCTRKVLFAITRNLNVVLAGDQHLRTSCICLRLQDLFRVMSVSMQDRCKIVFETCTYLLRLEVAGAFWLASLIVILLKSKWSNRLW